MIFHETSIRGAYVIELEPYEDERGSFSRILCQNEFAAAGVSLLVAQANLATSRRAGVLRGLHYHDKPVHEQKLVRCVAGAVFDVLIDMRADSPTYRTAFHTRLDAANRLSVFIPAGVAHGYQTLEPDSAFMYMTDHFYTPGFEKGVRFDDPALGVDWPLPPIDLTQRDTRWPLLAEAV